MSSDLHVEPWCLRETGLDLDELGQTESLFSLANGHIGLRGNLDEGEPHKVPGTYLNGLYASRPLPYAEVAYGYPEDGQSVVNATNGKVIRLLVEDEPLDLRYGELLEHERELDFRDGVLRRTLTWRSPSGRVIKVKSTRMVSLVQRAIAAVRYEVESADDGGPLRVVVQSELVANEALPEPDEDDPRVAAAIKAPLIAESSSCQGTHATLVHRTPSTDLRVAAAMDHEVRGVEDKAVRIFCEDDLARMTVIADLEQGEPIVIDKFFAYGYSSERSVPALRDQVEAALAEARHAGFDGLAHSQRDALDDFWTSADVEIDGDSELQQAVRFALFHVLQSAARGNRDPIPAKGLTGAGYDGHAFWDSEIYVLPVLTYLYPHASLAALRWRWRTLEFAKERAAQLGLEGAAFPWRTIHGEECSGYWPAGTAAFHVNAGIAHATIRYIAATEDEEFARHEGLELLVETARLWRSLGHHDAAGHFRIDGVTGPDEYSAIADNNLYTNVMAQLNLNAAANTAERYLDEASELGVDEEEAASWRDAAAAMIIPFDEVLGVHQQSEGFTHHARWDFETTPEDAYPLFLSYPYYDIYRKQVIKQADLVLALYLRGDLFSLEQKRTDFSYYEPLTIRDSSLSACVQSVVAAEVGFLDLAYDYLGEAALMDLHDVGKNSDSGLHMASLAGAWIAIVAGLGGMRDNGGELHFAPRLPAALQRIAFRVSFRGRTIVVEVRDGHASYELLEGAPFEVQNHGEVIQLEPGKPVRCDVPPLPAGLQAPPAPPGRESRRRGHLGHYAPHGHLGP